MYTSVDVSRRLWTGEEYPIRLDGVFDDDRSKLLLDAIELNSKFIISVGC
jgi:hypothetical protein